MTIALLIGSKACCRQWVHLDKPASKCMVVCSQVGNIPVSKRSQHLGWPAIQA